MKCSRLDQTSSDHDVLYTVSGLPIETFDDIQQSAHVQYGTNIRSTNHIGLKVKPGRLITELCPLRHFRRGVTRTEKKKINFICVMPWGVPYR